MGAGLRLSFRVKRSSGVSQRQLASVLISSSQKCSDLNEERPPEPHVWDVVQLEFIPWVTLIAESYRASSREQGGHL